MLEGVYRDINEKADEVIANPEKFKAEIQQVAHDIKDDPKAAFKKSGLGSFLEPKYTSIPFGLAFIAVGIMIAFLGRRIFKLFLGLSGFVVGGSVALYFLIKINDLFHFGPSRTVFWSVGVIGGLLGALLFSKAWKWGIYALSGYGGVMLGLWILGMINGTPANQYIERNTFLFVFLVIGVLLAHYIDEFVVISSSSLTGAFACVFGFDLIKFAGFRAFIKNTLDNTPINLVDHMVDQLKGDIRLCMLSVLFITVCGIYVQYRYQPRSYDRD